MSTPSYFDRAPDAPLVRLAGERVRMLPPPESSEPQNCTTCRFSRLHTVIEDEGTDSQLVCKRDPTSHVAGPDLHGDGMILLTRDESDWCGEFRRAPG